MSRVGFVTLVIFVALVIALAVSSRSPSAQDRTSACRPGSRTARASAPPRPGTYRLTMVAETGSRAGGVVRGNLWLAESDEGQQRRLYGHTDLALMSLGAVLDNDPLPSSTAPHAPGVLLWPDEMLLSVSTFSNRHTAGMIRLGPGGTGLWIRERWDSGFSGTWKSLGHVQDGYGYYCAVRVSR